MLSITLADLKSDIASMMKGTSVKQITDFYSTAAAAANRMLARIDPEETRRTSTLTSPFFDNVQDYVLVDDFKRMIDIRPQANLRQDMPGLSNFGQTSPKQFSQRLDSNSFSIRWNNAVRTLRAQRLPAGNVNTMDEFDVTISGSAAISEGSWSPEADISGLYAEPLNYVQGLGSLGFNLSGATGAGDIVNTTGPATDLSAFNNEDWSMIYFYIPVGYSSRFTSFSLRRGSSASAYIEQTVTTKADGTAFSDGWNYLVFNWATGTTTGSPAQTGTTANTYRRFQVNYSAGAAISGCLIDSWTDSFGQLYEIEYYSEYMFRTAAGVWIQKPTLDTDLVNVGTASHEILKAEMMIDITNIIRTGSVKQSELTEWRLQLNGTSASRWVKDPYHKGLYADYTNKFPSSAIVEATRTYDFDV
jgi:hypothetical protein